MNRKGMKYFLILSISLIISEILNGMVYLFSYNLIEYFITKDYIPYITEEKIDIISRILVALFAIMSYFFISKKIFCKYGDEKQKRNVIIILAIMIFLSYPLSAYFSIVSGWFYSTHWSMCAPISYVVLLPFLWMEKTIPMLYEFLFTLLSPISVLLIWLFSRTKKSENDV